MIFFRDGLEIEIKDKPKVYSTRDGHVVEEYLTNEGNGFFVTLNGTAYCAHGATLQEAITDALWKDDSKGPSLEDLRNEINKAGPARKINVNEFRLLTGACAEGCRVALKRAKITETELTVKEIKHHFPGWGETLYNVLQASND